ncbi:MAG: hypothetical protein Q4D31_08155 [Eubacteriales bacterium]|nr:hypothetical protein [Eubacteriales bacterium]
MQEEKSLVYTLILGVCMLLCLLLIGRMLLGQKPDAAPRPAPPQEEGTQMGIRLDEQMLSTLLTQALPFKPEGMAVQIGADGIVAVSVAVQRQTLADSGLVPGDLRTALLFLPERCKVYGAWRVAAQDGALSVQCTRAELAGIALPAAVTDVLSAAIDAALAQYLAEQQIAPQRLVWEAGAVTLCP